MPHWRVWTRSLPRAAAWLAASITSIAALAGLIRGWDTMAALLTIGPLVVLPVLWRAAIFARRREKIPFAAGVVPLLAAAAIAAVLATRLSSLPEFGAATAPAHQHIAPRYWRDRPVETGAANMIAAVLGTYRSFDLIALGSVILVAAITAAVVAVPVHVPADRRQPRAEPSASWPSRWVRLRETVEQALGGERLSAPMRRAAAIIAALSLGAAVLLIWFDVD